jgi:hypothetical protein
VSTNSHLFVWLSNFGLHLSKKLRLKSWNSDKSLNYNFSRLMISCHKSRVGAHKARQWVCPRFISVVCGLTRKPFILNDWENFKVMITISSPLWLTTLIT